MLATCHLENLGREVEVLGQLLCSPADERSRRCEVIETNLISSESSFVFSRVSLLYLSPLSSARSVSAYISRGIEVCAAVERLFLLFPSQRKVTWQSTLRQQAGRPSASSSSPDIDRSEEHEYSLLKSDCSSTLEPRPATCKHRRQRQTRTKPSQCEGCPEFSA
jgi:hypothetical protein